MRTKSMRTIKPKRPFDRTEFSKTARHEEQKRHIQFKTNSIDSDALESESNRYSVENSIKDNLE